MSLDRAIQLDVVIFGGGAAGLWVLDELHRNGYAALLLEAHELGSGQTIASQGIIHGGLKYTLKGLLTSSADAIREMPPIWRACLTGQRTPDLRNTRVRAEHCHLWRTDSIGSRLGMIGARVGLRVAPVAITDDARPQVLANCPGTVQRLDEQVIDPASFIGDLASQHRERIICIDADNGLAIDSTATNIHVTIALAGLRAELIANHAVLCAGEGNAMLRRMLGVTESVMQRRSLHMVLMRGAAIPMLNGHCVDGAKTRVTITSDRDSAGRTIWQIGGQLAEDGVAMERAELIRYARIEIAESLGGFDPKGVEWATYQVDRAEGGTSSGARPDDICIIKDGKALTAWPTKLALAPRLAERIMKMLPPPYRFAQGWSLPAEWPRPRIASPPWETERPWFADA